MSRQGRMEVHAGRALAELECARNAQCHEAAEAHLALSELHLKEMRKISDAPAGPTLRLVSSEEEEQAGAIAAAL